MPPERVLGGPGDERSDIYAIGCLLYALLTGRPPFTGDSAIAVMHQQVHAKPMPLAKAGARVTPGLSRLISRMLAKDPAVRSPSVRVQRRGQPLNAPAREAGEGCRWQHWHWRLGWLWQWRWPRSVAVPLRPQDAIWVRRWPESALASVRPRLRRLAGQGGRVQGMEGTWAGRNMVASRATAAGTS